MKTYYSEKEITTAIDADGKETRNVLEKTKSYNRICEPDYVKLYIKPWMAMGHDGCPGIPTAYRGLFLQLAMRMTYCNSDDIKSAQLVNTGSPFAEDIMRSLQWGRSMYFKGLKELVKCKAIRKISRGVYQVNPAYASRGEWTYNNKLHRGGVKEVIDAFRHEAGRDEKRAEEDPASTFKHRPEDVDLSYHWVDDGKDTPENREWRKGLGIGKGYDGGSLKTVVVKPDSTDSK